MRGARRVVPLSWECRIGMSGVGLWNRIGVPHVRAGVVESHRWARCPDRESRMDVPNARTGIMRTHDASSCPSHGNIASSPTGTSPTGTSHHRPWEYHPRAHRIGVPDIRPGVMESHRWVRCREWESYAGCVVPPCIDRPRMPPINPEGEAGHEPPAAGCIEALR
jgi:hypothetical protein